MAYKFVEDSEVNEISDSSEEINYLMIDDFLMNLLNLLLMKIVIL